jgi:hypothetical protein
VTCGNADTEVAANGAAHAFRSAHTQRSLVWLYWDVPHSADPVMGPEWDRTVRPMSTLPIAEIPADAATTGTTSWTWICPAPFITAVL